jgi:U3 small nucleolar RNA-associated protein 14
VNGIKTVTVRVDYENKNTTLMLSQETHCKDLHRLKVKGYRKICHVNTIQKKVQLAILFSDKTNFRTRNIIRNKEGALHND